MTETVPASKGNPGLPKNERKVDAAKALQLRLVKGMTYAEIGAVMGCTDTAVHAALSRFKDFLADAESGTLQTYRDNKNAIFDAVELRLMRSLMDEPCIEKASLNNRAYAFQQVANQNRLESGKSTSNIGILAKLTIEAEDRLGTVSKASAAKAIDNAEVLVPETGPDQPEKHA